MWSNHPPPSCPRRDIAPRRAAGTFAGIYPLLQRFRKRGVDGPGI